MENMEISNIENWYCENMTMFHEAAFLKLILFKHEMLEMTNRAQRDMTILPPPKQHNAGMALAFLTLCCPLMFQHTL